MEKQFKVGVGGPSARSSPHLYPPPRWGEAGEEDHSKAQACQASNPYVGISVRFDLGLDKLGRHQLHNMPMLAGAPRQILGTPTGFHPNRQGTAEP
jgi:hypothetical protein